MPLFPYKLPDSIQIIHSPPSGRSPISLPREACPPEQFSFFTRGYKLAAVALSSTQFAFFGFFYKDL